MTVLQYELQDKSGIEIAVMAETESVTSALRWKNGEEPSLKFMKNFSKALGKTIDELLKEHSANGKKIKK